MKKRIADIIMEELLKRGVDTCFGVVGGGAMFLDDALRKCEGIRKVFNHHEQASAMAAEAYARYSGKPALVCVTCGPGATNTLTGVMGAWQDSIPMIVVSGQVRYAISVPECGLNLRYRGIQEYQVIPEVKHMTKYAVTITDPLSISVEIDKAFHSAMDGRRGPVWIEVPQDLQNMVVDDARMYPITEYVSDVPKLQPDVACEVYELLSKAKRPCILSGSGIRSGALMEEFYSFVDKIRIPFVGASWVADSGYLEHPLFYGMSGNIGPRAGNFILQNADVILVLGNSLGFRQTGFNLEGFAPRAKIIMVDACADEARKPGLRVSKLVHASLEEFFRVFNDVSGFVDVSTEWRGYCDNLKNRFSPYEGAEGKEFGQAVNSYMFWKTFDKYEEVDSVLALGNNTACSAKLQIGTHKRKQRVLSNYTCGSMGYDLPAAIGGAIASGKRVYCITGDGSIMMNLQELQTIRHYDLPVHVVVFNNDGYNAIRQTSKNFFEGKYIGCSPDTGVGFPEFQDVARTFGFEYRRCETNGDLERELSYLTGHEDRILLEVMQSFDDPVIPKVMSRLDENGNMQTPILQDMYPFLEREVYDKYMINEGDDETK